MDIETPTDRAGEELVQNVKAHVRNVLAEPLRHQNAKAREVIVTQVTMAAVQACFAFLSAHDGYRNPRPVEFEDLPEVDVRADEKVEAEKGGRRFGEPHTMYDWRGPRPDWYTGPLRSEGDPPPEDLPKARSPHNDSGVT